MVKRGQIDPSLRRFSVLTSPFCSSPSGNQIKSNCVVQTFFTCRLAEGFTDAHCYQHLSLKATQRKKIPQLENKIKNTTENKEILTEEYKLEIK